MLLTSPVLSSMVFHLPTTPCAAADSVRKNREAKNNSDFIINFFSNY
jgi:hypothetical protein